MFLLKVFSPHQSQVIFTLFLVVSSVTTGIQVLTNA